MYISRSAMRGMGYTCEEMLNLAETFERLAGKTDKSAQTRANAASNAQLWRTSYQSCLNERSIAAVDVSLPVVPAAASAGASDSPTTAASGTRSILSTALIAGGALLGGALILGAVLRRRA